MEAPHPPQHPTGPPSSVTPHTPHLGFGHEVPQLQGNDQPVYSPHEVTPPPAANPSGGQTGHNPYEFILAPKPPAPKGWLLKPGSGNGLLVRAALVLAVVLVLVIGAAIALSAFGPKGSAPSLTAVAERQQEIIRIATATSNQVNDQDTQNFVANTAVSVASCQQQILGYLASHGARPATATLALDKSTATDTLLQNATSAGNYDSVAAQTLASQLQTDAGLLRTAYSEASNKTAKQIVQACFSSTGRLVEQAKNLQPTN